MSQRLIRTDPRELEVRRTVSGSRRETVVREAFKDLLKDWGRPLGLTFVAEYALTTAFKTRVVLDGALLHELRLPLGYWEAKDADVLIQHISVSSIRSTMSACTPRPAG